jgi:hypothetical protein
MGNVIPCSFGSEIEERMVLRSLMGKIHVDRSRTCICVRFHASLVEIAMLAAILCTCEASCTI